MSLLLQALHKAARNREDQGPATDAAEAAAAGARPAGDPAPETEHRFQTQASSQYQELTLADEEELFGDDATMTAREPAPGLSTDEKKRPVLVTAASPRAKDSVPETGAPAQAATILRASDSKGPSVIDRIRDRPVHALAIVAGIFGVFYGGYVYLAIFHPGMLRGDFLRRPVLQAKTPPPPAVRPLSPPEQVAAAPTVTPAAAAPATAASPMATPAPVPDAAAPAPGEPSAKAGAGTPKPAGRTAKRKPDLGEPAVEETADAGEISEAAPRRAGPRRNARRAQVEVDSPTLDDSVAVRTPERQPAAVLGTLTRAWEALQQGRYEAAQTLYDEVAKTEPENVDALLGLAALAGLRGNTEQAGRLYGRALELEPRNTAAQAGLISIIGQADPQLSESRLKQLVAREPSGFLYFALGNLYAKQAQWPQAQQAYFQAYQLQSDNPDYAYNLAIGLEHLGQSKIALNYYRRAIELRILRGRAEFDQTRVEERIGQLAARVGNQ